MSEQPALAATSTLSTFSPHASPPRSRSETPHTPHSLDICGDTYNGEVEVRQVTPLEPGDVKRSSAATIPSGESSSPTQREGNPLNSANRSLVSDRTITSASSSFANDPDLFDYRLLRESSTQCSPNRSTASTPRSCVLEPPSVLDFPFPPDGVAGLWKAELVDNSWSAVKEAASVIQVGEQLGRSLSGPMDHANAPALSPGHELAELLDAAVSFLKRPCPSTAATQIRELAHTQPGCFIGRYPARLVIDAIIRCLRVYLGDGVTVSTTEAWKSFVCCMWGRREIG